MSAAVLHMNQRAVVLPRSGMVCHAGNRCSIEVRLRK